MNKVLLYYKYINIDNPENFCEEHKALCNSLNLKGRIIIASEGINGTVEGTDENVKKYMQSMQADPRFADINFKISESDGNSFPKLSCKARSEIVSLNLGEEDIDPNKVTGKYISAEELNTLIHSREEFYIIDMRNDYEHTVGQFENSILPPMGNFRELPKFLPKIESLKNKKIVTVCTGGVRCEKASGLLVKHGFKDVYQLKDGIVTYMEKYPNQDFLGQLYVFDGRITMGFNLDDPNRKIIGKCEKCGTPCEIFTNCANLDCHRHFICCSNCANKDGKKYCKVCDIHGKNPEKRLVKNPEIKSKIISDISELDFEQLKKNLPVSEENQDFDYIKTKQYINNRNNIFLVGYHKNEIAGLIIGQKIEALDSRREFFISEVGVSSKFRRLGIGTDMLQTLLDFLKQRKYTQCWVLTENCNIEAIGLYQKLEGKPFKDTPIGYEWDFRQL